MTRPFNVLSARTKVDNAERAAQIKARGGVADAISALGLDGDPGTECPRCGLLDGLEIAKSGETFACGGCGFSGDAISLVREARGVGFSAACDILEDIMPARKCAKTRELFG